MKQLKFLSLLFFFFIVSALMGGCSGSGDTSNDGSIDILGTWLKECVTYNADRISFKASGEFVEEELITGDNCDVMMIMTEEGTYSIGNRITDTNGVSGYEIDFAYENGRTVLGLIRREGNQIWIRTTTLYDDRPTSFLSSTLDSYLLQTPLYTMKIGANIDL